MFRTLRRLLYQVEDLEQAKRWYSDILGSPPVFDTPAAAIFQAGDCSLSLVQASQPLPCEGSRLDAYWEVDDVAAAIERLTVAGARIVSPMRDFMQTRTALLVDPFGNRLGLTGMVPKPAGSSPAERPSQTATTTAFSRALAFREARPSIRGRDSLADRFLPDEACQLLQSPVSVRSAIEHIVTAPLYAYFLARTAYLDALFEQACREGLPQIVLLGAGYDTRPYRLPEPVAPHLRLASAVSALRTRIFELDGPATQRRKREILARAGVHAPDSLVYAPIDFEQEPIADTLQRAGYDPSQKTLFIWEGVSYYLSEAAVQSTLSFVARHASAGSRLCFDYLLEKLESVSASEPFRFWAARPQLAALLSAHGLAIVEELDATELERRYLTLPDGSLAERCLTRFSLVLAEAAG